MAVQADYQQHAGEGRAMSMPAWIWYLIAGIVILLVAVNLAGGVLAYRRFRRMERDFDEQRERVRNNLRGGR
jgi:hypothetical protein